MASSPVDRPSGSSAKRHNGDREPQAGPAKRARIRTACEQCQTRKTRCDGAEPVCGACARRRSGGHTCTYKQDIDNKQRLFGYISQLKSRIQELEAQNGENNETAPDEADDLAESLDTSPRHIGAAPVQGTRLDQTDLAHIVPGYASPPNDPQQPFWQAIDGVDHGVDQEVSQLQSAELVENNDGMGITGASGGKLSPFGSSTASFVQQIKEAVAAKASTPDGSLSRRFAFSNKTDAMDENVCRVVAENCVLPARELADEMLDVYWDEVHVLYPFLHRPQFMELYQNLWTANSARRSNRMTYCILNTIFAICSQVNKRRSVSEHEIAANIYFRRALRLLQVEVFGPASQGLLQALLLVSQYLQCTESPQSCWATVGLATRVAHWLGLHVAETGASLRNQRDREMVRRLWHGCVFMDRIMAMTLGRPMTISRADAMLIPFPSSIDDEYLSLIPDYDAEQPTGLPSRIAFFVATVRLYESTERILSCLYSNNPVAGSGSRTGLSLAEKLEILDFNEILRLDSCLTKWSESLPPFLVAAPTPVNTRNDPIFPRQANILRLRYLHLQNLLFRPLLYLLVSENRTSLDSPGAQQLSLAQEMARVSARKCVLAAQQLIGLVHENQSNDDSVEALPIWWYQVYYVYSAAIALIPARLSSLIRGDLSPSSILTSWQQALLVLERLSNLSTSARHCITVLEILSEHIPGDAGANPTLPTPPSPSRSQPVVGQMGLPWQPLGAGDLGFEDVSLLSTIPELGFPFLSNFEEDTAWLDF